jgi:hypothetical protein
MRDPGHGKNSIYNINAKVPSKTMNQRSKVPKNYGQKEKINNGIYSFGAKTGINI